MPGKRKTKIYTVPTVVHGTFGCELEVEATSAKEARRLIRAGKGQMSDGDGYDWDRFIERKYTVGSWQRITSEAP